MDSNPLCKSLYSYFWSNWQLLPGGTEHCTHLQAELRCLQEKGFPGGGGAGGLDQPRAQFRQAVRLPVGTLTSSSKACSSEVALPFHLAKRDLHLHRLPCIAAC